MIQLKNAIAQNEEKRKIPTKINIFHLIASWNSPNMEIGTLTPTKIGKAKVTLKDPKSHFPLFTLFFPFYSALTLTVLNDFTSISIYLHTALYNLSPSELGKIRLHSSEGPDEYKTFHEYITFSSFE